MTDDPSEIVLTQFHGASRGQIKFEILNPKHETNPNDQNLNDQNETNWKSFSSSCLEHWGITILNLFRISIFGFRTCHNTLCSMLIHNGLPTTPVEWTSYFTGQADN